MAVFSFWRLPADRKAALRPMSYAASMVTSSRVWLEHQTQQHRHTVGLILSAIDSMSCVGHLWNCAELIRRQ